MSASHITPTAHPAWCAKDHQDQDSHRRVLWQKDHFDMKRVRVSLIAFGDQGEDANPEIGLELTSSEDQSQEIWLSLSMAATLITKLTEAIVKADEALRTEVQPMKTVVDGRTFYVSQASDEVRVSLAIEEGDLNASSDVEPATCPAWCSVDHTRPEDEGFHLHAVLDQPFGTVEIEEDTHGPRCYVHVPGDHTLTPEDALKMAEGIVIAAKLAAA